MLQLKPLSFAIITTLAVSSFSLPVSASSNLDAKILKRLEIMEQRLQALEAENARLKKSLNEPYISDSEPEISARLKAVESQSNSHKKFARIVEALEGIEVGGGVTMVGQKLSSKPDTGNDAEVNYRGDLTVSLPAGDIGNASGFLFTHVRVGQGLGLENPDGAFSSLNSTSFERPGSSTSDSTILLAQLWYQLTVPLPLGIDSEHSHQHLEMNIGKMDPFMFFDQNSIADDETRGFMNQSFVHNPLLDTGGDEFGFTPGFRMAWVNDTYKPVQYAISFGAFGAGDGASFDDTLSDPFYIVQAETSQRLFSGLTGNYRIYYWKDYDHVDLSGVNKQTHAGFGLSLDQQVHDYITVFARYGQQTQGDETFDQAMTLGAEFGGSYWSRGGDAIGAALGFLSLSDEYKDLNSGLNGDEQVAELFYRYRINEQIHLSANIQHIRNPGGDEHKSSLTAYGLRAQLDF